MEISFRVIMLITGIILTGLTAGLCFTWSNAVTPGIGKLDSLGYLQAFQAMNRSIINPVFIMVFFGPVLVQFANVYLFKNAPKQILILLIAAAAVYFVGLFLVTVMGNVPLNEILDKTDLGSATSEELSSLRERFESRWNRLHMIRTVTSIISFIMLTVSLALSTRVVNV
jgi:uncharacterized membrane protein